MGGGQREQLVDPGPPLVTAEQVDDRRRDRGQRTGDVRCGEILAAVRQALPPGGRVLVIEVELTDDGPAWPKFVDIVMLAVLDARQRTNDEYRALLVANGFDVVGQTSTPGGLTLIEAEPVPSA